VARQGISIAVIGGGIGGLAAALSLLRAGFDVHVYEQAKELREVGAGIQVSPNASRILLRLGLAKDLATAGVRAMSFHQRRWDDGRTLLRSPLGDTVAATFGAPHYQVHRADLLSALLRALPAERLHVGQRCVGLREAGDRVEAEFASGARIVADIVVGADGIHSTVRHLILGAETPRVTGCVAYRGLVPADRLAHLDLPVECEIWMGPDKHFVHYFVQAGRLVNFVAIVEEDSWTRESWTDRGDIADVLTAYAGWHKQLHAILGAADETFKWGLFERPPLPRWSIGRVTLMGDACHAMLPFLAQGAAQAIEDGSTLAACLAKFGELGIPETLRIYETLRLPRASRVQAMSRDNKTRFHLPDGPEQQARDGEMASGATDWSFKAVGWIYAHDAHAVDGAVPLPV
jgi:salicylate hydroxylase